MRTLLNHFFRFTARQFGTSLITIAGLATGLAAAFLILMWAMDELSYERFNEQINRIYMVNQVQHYSGQDYRVAVTPYPCGPVWREQIPAIEEAVRIVRLHHQLLRTGDKSFYEPRMIAADSGFFSIFTSRVIQGDIKSAVRHPHAIILTEKLARKYFGNQDPIGKTIELENTTLFTVEAVIADPPRNTRLRYEAIIPYAYLAETGQTSDNWGSNTILTFVLLKPNAEPTEVNQQMTNIVHQQKETLTADFYLLPWTDFHLRTLYGSGEGQKPIARIYIFFAIALFIILIACINFVNLSTAKATFRAKEIGIRKSAGANRSHMILQFLGESGLTVLLAMLLALGLAMLILGPFNTISGKQFRIDDLFQWDYLLAFLATGILTAILAGIYPAFYLSSLNPVTVLRGEKLKGSLNSWLRKGLVVVQFTLSVFIALGAVFMYLQLRYMQNKELGYQKENVICISMADNMKERYDLLRSELLNTPGVESVAASSSNPVEVGSNSSGAMWDEKDPKTEVLIGFNGIDEDYIQTMGIHISGGRSFSREFPGDKVGDTTGNFLVNEEVARLMGGGDVVGKRFSFLGIQGIIAGVMQNFHFEGVAEPINPMAFYLTEGKNLDVILIRLSPGNTPDALASLEKTWNRVIPDYPLEYTFLDQDYEALYESETRIGLLLKYFTIIALIIACMGLYGLSAWEASRRTREIGVRKAMGAGIFTILIGISREYFFMILVSIGLACILAWFIVGSMLDQFAYRIPMGAGVFLLTGFAALIIAMFTISIQTIRASEINPSLALRNE